MFLMLGRTVIVERRSRPRPRRNPNLKRSSRFRTARSLRANGFTIAADTLPKMLRNTSVSFQPVPLTWLLAHPVRFLFGGLTLGLTFALTSRSEPPTVSLHRATESTHELQGFSGR